MIRMSDCMQIALMAKNAVPKLALLGRKQKDNILLAMADALILGKERILLANEEDITKAKENGMSESLLDRLKLTDTRIQSMADGVRAVIDLDDPTSRVLSGWKRPNGLWIEKRCVPLGVVGIIYEARPNVTTDVVSLCIKSGNACVLRGGREAIASNSTIMEVLTEAGVKAGMPEGGIGLITDTDRSSALEMMRANGVIDVLIPRGGVGLIRSALENATVPVIETGVGICHIYIDESADFEMARAILINAKCSRPSVCNAAETLLIHQNIAGEFLPKACESLAENGVELRGCGRSQKIAPDTIKKATEEDWATEYNDLIINIGIVDDIDQAISHIAKYGTRHSESIITNDHRNAERFLDEVDSACVYVNASTRFTDGFEFGFGSEIGISTQKLHARGPMGLNELTSIKYVIRGDGQTR
jgi:glutamate-5-semialdehyde dehydrogenase